MEEQFLNLLEQSKNSIHRICNVYAKNEEDAKDLFQEVLLQIWKSLASFRGQSNINTWTYRIALNICMQEQNKRERNKRSLYMPTEHVTVLEAKKYEELYTCIRSLNEADRGIILLLLEDMSYKEIAAITGLTENHVAVKMKRIKLKLSNCLKQNL